MNKKNRKNIVNGVLILIGIPFLIALASLFTGIGAKNGGFKTYQAFSENIKGQNFIIKNKIKYVAKDVWTVAFIEVYRGEAFFAYNVDHNNYYFYENIKYKKVPKEIVNKYEFSAHFNWLETYGKYIIYFMFGICAIICAIISIFIKFSK